MTKIIFENDKYRIGYDIYTEAIEIETLVDMDPNWLRRVGTVEDNANNWLRVGKVQEEKILKYIKGELGIKDSDKPEDNVKGTLKEHEVVVKNKKENKKMLTRKEILQKVEQIVCQDREKQYGSPEDNFTKIAKLWNAYRGTDDITPADVAVMMALLKIARISSGEYKEDSWIDLVGYAICGGAIASMEDD